MIRGGARHTISGRACCCVVVGDAGWSVEPGPDPQSFPQELIDAAIAAGVAEPVKPARKGQKKESQDG